MSKQKKSKRPDTAGQRRGAARSAPKRQAVDDQPPIVGFVSLGCAKNLVDSEKMLGEIAESGAIISGDESMADTIVVNTCGFLEASRQEALETIRELADRKRYGTLRRLVVAGCLVQRDGEQLRDLIPEIDALVGVNNRQDVAPAVWGPRQPGAAVRPREKGQRAARPPVALHLGEYHPQPWSDQGRLRLTPPHYAYVRISEGCNQKCTFCTIPSIRGPMHCKTPEALVAECRELIADGAQELILIGQDTTSYGAELAVGSAGYDGQGLAGLLRTLDRACDGARWLRLMYVYPSLFTDEMIDAIAAAPRVVKYIDIPLQHINDRVLRAMGRRVTRAQTETLLEKLRQRIPGVTIRTTFIVGFPGETEAEFAELVEFVRGFGFDAVGAFKYSLEADTPAAKIPGHLDEAVKVERYERLMLAQQEHALAAGRRSVGTAFEVVVDSVDDGTARARHAGQAPEVDSVALLRGPSAEELAIGDWLPVRCVETDGYDLIVQPARRQLSLPQAPRA